VFGRPWIAQSSARAVQSVKDDQTALGNSQEASITNHPSGGEFGNLDRSEKRKRLMRFGAPNSSGSTFPTAGSSSQI